jgi:hypothetical protein
MLEEILRQEAQPCRGTILDGEADWFHYMVDAVQRAASERYVTRSRSQQREADRLEALWRESVPSSGLSKYANRDEVPRWQRLRIPPPYVCWCGKLNDEWAVRNAAFAASAASAAQVCGDIIPPCDCTRNIPVESTPWMPAAEDEERDEKIAVLAAMKACDFATGRIFLNDPVDFTSFHKNVLKCSLHYAREIEDEEYRCAREPEEEEYRCAREPEEEEYPYGGATEEYFPRRRTGCCDSCGESLGDDSDCTCYQRGRRNRVNYKKELERIKAETEANYDDLDYDDSD